MHGGVRVAVSPHGQGHELRICAITITTILMRLLTWRYDQDIAPAMLQTWFNPTIDVPWYLMMKYMSAWTVGFALGAVHGNPQFQLVSLIAWRMVRRLPPFTRGLVAVAAATFGCAGPIFIMELGSTNHDTTLSSPCSHGSLAAAWDGSEHVAPRRYLIVSLAGALMGAATASTEADQCRLRLWFGARPAPCHQWSGRSHQGISRLWRCRSRHRYAAFRAVDVVLVGAF